MSKNRLAFEQSPYLLQHARNPMDWFPWGEEAFSVARATNKPVFLSVGYSTCHWCHVMAHESFENPEIARICNELFVNIKVDREERPDIDRVYMAFVQATTGGGGWPLSVWLTPQGEPIFGGTYFPPDDRHGRPGLLQVAQAIDDLWKRNPQQVIEQGRAIFAALSENSHKSSNESIRSAFSLAINQFASSFDHQNGGFGSAPKFPRASSFEFLLRSPEKDENALQMGLFSLRKIALGGICDHLGGGFHRYSVDQFWKVPHFEKMLYDQAQLAIVFTEAFRILNEPLFAQTVLHTLEYVERDLSDPHGGFYSAEDADSEDGGGRQLEGAFYLWNSSEIMDLLGPSHGRLFCQAYGVLEDGNVPEESDPHAQFKGLNILFRRLAYEDLAKEFGQTLETVTKVLAEARQRLFKRREQRPRPHRDDKVLAAWNGLAISAFARAGVVFQQEGFVERASKAAHFVRTQMWKDGRLQRSWRALQPIALENRIPKRNERSSREESVPIAGFAADYAFLIQGLLDLYEASFYSEWLAWALELQSVLDCEFWDEAAGSYYESTGKDVCLPLSLRDQYDGAEPTANSVCTLNLFRLARMFRNAEFERRGDRILSCFLDKKAPTNLPFLLAAALFREGPPEEIVIAGSPDSAQTHALQYAIRRQFRPNSVLILADGNQGSALLSKMNPALLGMKPQEGQQSTAYICKGYACQAVVTNPLEIRSNY
ncbi:MAG: thioredoxin domain-containing protein [Verrucomicrobia bacterium]|nr:MAG: thioredoxin domain-containing protein [Verrucomicrobiota bacterium]